MKSEIISSPFLKKIDNQKGEKQFRAIISFGDIGKRDKFISKYNKLKILGKFTFIPSINVNLSKEQVMKYGRENLIKKIEEDQRLYQSLLDVLEITGLNDFKKSQIPYTGKNVKVGIIDTGIDDSYPFINHNVISHHGNRKRKESIKKGDWQSKISHGTVIASILSNHLRDNNNNFIGIAPNIKLIDFNILTQKNEFFLSSILEIVDLIINENIELDILLISFTTIDPSDGTDILSLTCDSLVDRGIIVISPAGNGGPELNTIGSPGAGKKVITIGALTKELAVSTYSGRGPTIDGRIKPDFCLPGSEIKIPISNELIVNATGTSVAAAIGVGLISLIKEFNPNATYSDIIELIRKSSTDLNYERSSQGCGLVKIPDVFKTLNLFQEKTFPYSFLIKKSLKFSIEIITILIVLYFIFHFFRVV